MNFPYNIFFKATKYNDSTKHVKSRHSIFEYFEKIYI